MFPPLSLPPKARVVLLHNSLTSKTMDMKSFPEG